MAMLKTNNLGNRIAGLGYRAISNPLIMGATIGAGMSLGLDTIRNQPHKLRNALAWGAAGAGTEMLFTKPSEYLKF